jgi:hypothetical protein
MVVVETARGVTSSLAAPDIKFPRFQEWNALLPNRRKRVNTILKLLTTNSLLLEPHALASGHDMPQLEEPHYNRITYTGDPIPRIFRQGEI